MIARHLRQLLTPLIGWLPCRQPEGQRLLAPAETRKRLLAEQARFRRNEPPATVLKLAAGLRTRRQPQRFAQLVRFCLSAAGTQGAVGYVESGRLVLIIPQADEQVVRNLIEQLAIRWGVDAETLSLPTLDGFSVLTPPVGSACGIGNTLDPDPFYLDDGHRFGMRRLAKRACDVAIASSGLLLLSPIFLLLAVTVKITSPGPVFAVYDRMGRRGRPCRIYRFRGRAVRTASALRHRGNRPRQEFSESFFAASPTSIGSFLHETRLDRLPQLWNVLRGDLSL